LRIEYVVLIVILLLCALLPRACGRGEEARPLAAASAAPAATPTPPPAQPVPTAPTPLEPKAEPPAPPSPVEVPTTVTFPEWTYTVSGLYPGQPEAEAIEARKQMGGLASKFARDTTRLPRLLTCIGSNLMQGDTIVLKQGDAVDRVSATLGPPTRTTAKYLIYLYANPSGFTAADNSLGLPVISLQIGYSFGRVDRFVAYAADDQGTAHYKYQGWTR